LEERIQKQQGGQRRDTESINRKIKRGQGRIFIRIQLSQKEAEGGRDTKKGYGEKYRGKEKKEWYNRNLVRLLS